MVFFWFWSAAEVNGLRFIVWVKATGGGAGGSVTRRATGWGVAV